MLNFLFQSLIGTIKTQNHAHKIKLFPFWLFSRIARFKNSVNTV